MSTLPNESKAAVFYRVGEPLVIERFPIPALAGREVLVRIRCATLCGSDLHSYFGRRPTPVPGILGHEMIGEIVGIGPDGATDYFGKRLAFGDRVTWSMVWSCGHCFFCRRGLGSKCERRRKFGHEAIEPGRRELFGGLAEYCHLPERTAIFRVPGSLSDAVASPANCATATVAAVLRRAGEIAGQSIVVHGAGMLGHTASAMATEAGARQVIVLEPSPPRRESARAFGATEVWDSSLPVEETLAQVQARTEDRGADVAIELSGVPEAVELGFRLLRPGGHLILVGSTFPSRPVPLSPEQIVRRMIQIVGVHNYEPEDLHAALEFLSRTHDRFPFQGLIHPIFPLDAVNAAFNYAERERPSRVAVIP
jgi:alcohol dehydrogenase